MGVEANAPTDEDSLPPRGEGQGGGHIFGAARLGLDIQVKKAKMESEYPGSQFTPSHILITGKEK
jgi:hypothetical protein